MTKLRARATDSKNISTLKKACQELLSKIGNSEEDKKIAKNWCNKNSTLITSDNNIL